MPSVKQSARPDTKGWTPVSSPFTGAVNATPPAQPDTTGRSPFMAASMPLMASTGDAFTRQFYSKTGLPSQRILPAKRGAGA